MAPAQKTRRTHSSERGEKPAGPPGNTQALEPVDSWRSGFPTCPEPLEPAPLLSSNGAAYFPLQGHRRLCRGADAPVTSNV